MFTLPTKATEAQWDDPFEYDCTVRDIMGSTLFDKITLMSFKDWNKERLIRQRRIMAWSLWTTMFNEGQIAEKLDTCLDFMERMNNWLRVLNDVREMHPTPMHIKRKAMYDI